MRLNEALEQDNAQLEAELADLLRLNLGIRGNIEQMEAALGLATSEPSGTDSEAGESAGAAETADG